MTEPTAGDEPIRLGDRYELGGLLGRGGMADVRVGRDLRLGRTVAVKRLRSDLASDPTFQERFRREAQSAAALNHPSIVAVYDTGEAVAKDGHNAPYIVMEYVEGQTLREITHDGRKILPERALDITADVLSALDYSHRSGIVHRDIKPANVMLTPSGQVKVMDFGIARAIADTSSAMTQTAAVIGTAQYLSPEQARGETVDARSDIYSTGCLLYELLTGRPPFVGDSPVSVAYQHVREEARPPSALNPDVSPNIDHIVAKALAKRTDDRYQSAADMRNDIERAIAGHAVDAPTAATQAIGGATSTMVAPVLPPPSTRAAGGARKAEDDGGNNTAKKVGIVLGVLLLLGLIVFGLWKLNSEPDPVMVSVPTVVGKDLDTATRALGNEGLKVGEVTEQPSADVDEGLVSEQTPDADEMIEEGGTVDLTVSTGPEQVTVPYVVGKSLSDATKELEALGLEVKMEAQASDRPKNEVISSNPVFQTKVDPGSEVTLIVSEGQI
ncbi:MAG TPA: Stk1 family PASTA domain-containing Ser/Thr kinase, partial [Aeromicrobium sp.]|nr:Stk1 family PASTA domain-containing Ser/Thr kinase [Aeromicrobium sp.]